MMMKQNMVLLVAAVVVVVVAFASSEVFAKPLSYEKKTLWHQLDEYTPNHYLKEFGRDYCHTNKNEECVMRVELIERRLHEIRTHNKDTTKSWKEGVNHFTDRTTDEIKMMMGYNRKMRHTPTPFVNVHTSASDLNMNDLPEHIDWAEDGFTTPVKDQGACGSCWTFATAETVESHYAIHQYRKTNVKSLVELSEQQIASCSSNPRHCGGTGGCEGGTAEVGFAGIIEAGGLASEWSYPYISHEGKDFKCMLNVTKPKLVVQIKDYEKLPANEYKPLMNAVAKFGPIAISVDASLWSKYESGIFDGCNQTNPELDHAVQLVGYGATAEGQTYWKVRNSWTSSWGEYGYIRLARYPVRDGDSPRCGYDTNPGSGSGCDGGPSVVKTCGTCGILSDNAFPLF